MYLIKWIIIFIILFIVPSSALADSPNIDCGSNKTKGSHKTTYPIIEEYIISPDKPLTNSQNITCTIDKRMNETFKLMTEEGFYKGLGFIIYYSDGGGRIQNKKEEHGNENYSEWWRTNCPIDPIEDTKFCGFYKKDFVIVLFPDGGHVVSIDSKTAKSPNSQVIVRIDKNTPIRADAKDGFNQLQTQQIIQEMKLGKKIVTRYKKWPNNQVIDKTYTLYKMEEAFEILDWMVKNLKGD